MRLIYTSLFLVLSVLVLSGVFFVVTQEDVSAHLEDVSYSSEQESSVRVAQTPPVGGDSVTANAPLEGKPACRGSGSNRYCFMLPAPIAGQNPWKWDSYRNRDRGKYTDSETGEQKTHNTSWQHFAFDIYEGWNNARQYTNPQFPTQRGGRTGLFAMYNGTIVRVANAGVCGGEVTIKYDNGLRQRFCHTQLNVHIKGDGGLVSANDPPISDDYQLISINNIPKRVQAGDLIGYLGGTGGEYVPHLHTDFYVAQPQIFTEIQEDFDRNDQLREGDIVKLNPVKLGLGLSGGEAKGGSYPDPHSSFVRNYCDGNVNYCSKANKDNCCNALRCVQKGNSWVIPRTNDCQNKSLEDSCGGGAGICLNVEKCYESLPESSLCTSTTQVGGTPPDTGPTPPDTGPTPGSTNTGPPNESGNIEFFDSYLEPPNPPDQKFYDFTVIPGDPPELNRGTFDLNLEVDWPSIPGIGTLNTLVSDGLSLNELIVFVYTLLLWLSIILAFLALIYAGFLYIVSGANPGARSKAFDYVKRIAFGGTILLLTVLILSFINTDLVAPQRGIGGYVSDAEIKALNDVMCRVEEDQLQINACVAPLPEQLRDSFSDYNYIGNNYAFIDYNKTLITNLSNNFVGTETEVFGEQGGLNLKHGQMTLEDAVNKNTLIQRIDELREGGQYDIRKCETHESTLAALNELRNRLTTKHSANSREYSNAGGDQYSSFAIDLYKLVFNTYFFSESDGDADLSNNNNVNSIEYQLGELWRLNRFDTKERANYLTNKMFGNNTDEDSYLYTGLLTLAQAQEQARENGLAGVNPMRVDVYHSLNNYSAITDDLQKKNDELADKYEELRQDQGIERREIGECESDLCIEIQELDNEVSVLQGQLDQVDNLQNSSPQNYNHAEDFFFTIESTLDINNPEGRFDESQRLWIWVHIPATEILDILESMAGATDPEEKCGVSKKACNEGECTDQQGNNQSECVYGIVENTLKNALPNNCSPTPEAGEEVSGQDALKKLGELRMLEDFKRMRNELSLQITRIEHANQFRSELDALHTCDSLRVYFERLKKLQNSKQEGVYDDGDGQCKTDRLAVGGFQVDVDNDNDNQVLTYEQQLEYLVCCPSEDEGRNQSIQEITESCGGVNVVLCSLPVPTTSSE